MNKTAIYSFVLFFFLPLLSLANLRALIKNAIKSESKVVVVAARDSKFLVKNSDQFLKEVMIPASKELQASKLLYKGVRRNIKKFVKKRYLDLLDFGLDISSNLATMSIDPAGNYDFKKKLPKYFLEIRNSRLFSQLYKSMCKKFSVDTLTPSAQFLALNGALINGVRMKSESLYQIYLVCSQSFAYDELLMLQNTVGCDQEKQEEVKNFAKRMKIKLPNSNCEAKDEEADWLTILLGILVWVVIIYFTYKFIVWGYQGISKIISIFK